MVCAKCCSCGRSASSGKITTTVAPHLGLIAQEVEKVIPEVIQRSSDRFAPLGMSYSDLVPVIIKAIQEQHTDFAQKDAELRLLKAENATLREQNAEMDARIAALEQAMQQLMGQLQQAQRINPH